MRRLAIDGGTPAFDEPRHVGAPNVRNRARFQQLLDEALDRNWLSNNGPLVQRFERAVAAHAGVEHCVAVSNATSGLQLAVRGLGLSGEVIVPAHTFVATAHAVRWLGGQPVFADVDPRTHSLHPASVRRLVTSRTTGVLGVHLWGRAGDVDGLADLADELDLELLYDAAHAFCSTKDGVPITSFGRASVVSFHATKFLSTFEGGAVLTDDPALAEDVRRMANFGFTGRDTVDTLGTNAKMSEVAAAMGLAQLEVVDDTLAANHARLGAYRDGLAGIDGIRLLLDAPGQVSNGQYVVLEVDALRFGRTRDELLAALEAERVMARRYFWPGAHRMEPYASESPNADLLLPETERLSAAVLALPTGLAMSLADVDTVCHLVRSLARTERPAAPSPRDTGARLP